MKKMCVISAMLLIVLLAMSSCQTFTSIIPIKVLHEDYTEDMAESALRSTISRASESASARFYQRMGTYNFVPDSYSMILENQSKVPGMKKLISTWNSNVEETLIRKRTILENAISNCIAGMPIENSKSLVEDSNTSITYLMDTLYGSDFKELLKSIFEDMDLDSLNNMVNHYNAWISSENFKNKTNIKKLDSTDCKPYLIDSVYNYYKNDLLTFEELYRTIPDPYTEDVCKKVFGIE